MIEFLDIWKILIIFGFNICLLLGMIVYTKFNWVLKSVLTISSVFIFIMAYLVMSNTSGYPTKDMMPSKLMVLWTHVEEPTDSKKGRIIYWVKDLESDNTPRLHEIPYSKEKHKEALGIKQKLQQGKTIVGNRKGKGKASANESKDGQGTGKDVNGKGKMGATYREETKGDVQFREVEGELPSKDY